MKLNKALKWGFMDFPGYIIKISVAWGIILGAVSYVAAPHIQPWLELPERVESGSRRLSSLERSIRALSPPNVVAEYDHLRSSVLNGTCRIGEWCSGEYRVRRLPAGVQCDAPNLQGFVTNHGGVTRPVVDNEIAKIRVGSDWINIPFKFKVPKGSQPGTGEFYYELSYSCPTGMEEEPTPVIVFTIIE